MTERAENILEKAVWTIVLIAFGIYVIAWAYATDDFGRGDFINWLEFFGGS